MKPNLVFVHGMFMNPVAWEGWIDFFEERGHTCLAPAWPKHSGAPATLRTDVPEGLGALTIAEVVASLREQLAETDDPVIVGHSMGGLITQLLIAEGLGRAGVCIDSAPPKGIASFALSFLKSNLPVINPLKGDAPYLMPLDHFRYTFCNTMAEEDVVEAYESFVCPESRNVARTSAGADGAVDFSAPHAPLLFIAGEHDNIIPASLNRKNHAAYKDSASVRDFKEFPGRGHFICGQKGWEEVAGHVADWIDRNAG